MFSSLILATAFAASTAAGSAPAPIAVEARMERIDVGYTELSEGRNSEALARIQASLEANSQDPAALINLAAAYSRLGRISEARTALEAAAASPERFDLQLADGRWLDSRQAAKLARTRLQEGQALALR
jgi:Tfp pilus assembly protein PilF